MENLAEGMARYPLITTVERHFLERKGRNPHATEEFSWLLSGITLATKIIAAYVQRAGLLEIMGDTGRINVQGEKVQKLDDFANETLVRCLGYRGTIGILVSEEDDEPHVIQEAESGKYKAGKFYSTNEAYQGSFPELIHRYLKWVKDAGNYSSRYIGSLV